MDGSKIESRDSDGHLRCEACGYDLHNNKTGQCPECGAAGPGAIRMPPQWWVLIGALGLPCVMLLVWMVVALLFRMV